MRCPSCKKKVVFGSVRPEAWNRIHEGEWLLGGRPPRAGTLGDCPACGVRLEWEPDEQREAGISSTVRRVHLSALREAGESWRGRIAMRALVVENDGLRIASDSWRNRPRAGPPEDDGALVARLVREQVPRIEVKWSSPEAESAFAETARRLENGARAAWAEVEGAFEPREGSGTVWVTAVTSVWPPRD